MSNRYAFGLDMVWRFANEKQRAWFLDMINVKTNSILKRIQPQINTIDTLSRNIGVIGNTTLLQMAKVFDSIKLNQKDYQHKEDWVVPVAASEAQLKAATGCNMTNVMLLDSVWYASAATLLKKKPYHFAVRCISYMCETHDGYDEDRLRDGIISLLMRSNISEECKNAVRSELNGIIDAEGIFVVADFEMACNDS